MKGSTVQLFGVPRRLALACLAISLGPATLALLWRPFAWSCAALSVSIGVAGWWTTAAVAAWGVYEWRATHRPSASPSSRMQPATFRTVLSVGATAVLLGGNLSVNVAANRLSKHWEQRKLDGVDILRNHDLSRLVGQCVRLAILEHAEGIEASGRTVDRETGDVSERVGAMRRIAESAPAHWDRLTKAGDARVRALADGKLSAFIADQQARAHDTVTWHGLLADWNDEIGGPRASSESLLAAAEFVSTQFGRALREALKSDFTKGGKAWPALQLDIARRLLSDATARRDRDDEVTNAALQELGESLADLEEHIPGLHALVLRVQGSTDAYSSEVLGELGRVRASLSALEDSVERIERVAESILAEVEGQSKTLEVLANTQITNEEKYTEILSLLTNDPILPDTPLAQREVPAEVSRFISEMSAGRDLVERHVASVAIGELDRADELFAEYNATRAAGVPGRDFELWMSRGDRLVSGNHWRAATDAYRAALAARPGDALAMLRLGECLINDKESPDFTSRAQEATDFLLLALPGLGRIEGQNSMLVAECQISLAAGWMVQLRFDDAVSALEDGISTCIENPECDAEIPFVAAIMLAMLYTASGNPTEAHSSIEEAWSIFATDPESYERAKPLLVYAEGLTHMAAGSPAKARVSLEQALSKIESEAGVEALSNAMRVALGQAYLILDEYELSLEMLERARAYYERFAPGAPDRFAALYSLGSAYRDSGQHADAIPHFQQAADLAPDTPGLGRMIIQDSQRLIGRCYSALGDHDLALASFERSLQTARSLVPRNNSRVASVEKSIAIEFIHLERFEDAESLLRPLVDECATRRPHPTLGCASSMRHLGNCLKRLERYEEAIELLSESLAVGRTHIAGDDRGHVATLHQLADTYHRSGNAVLALESVTEGADMARRVLEPDDEKRVKLLELEKEIQSVGAGHDG